MKVKINQDRHIVKEVFEEIDSYNDNIADFSVGYHHGEAYFETDSRDLFDWVVKKFVCLKKYTVLYDVVKPDSDCLFDRQLPVWAHNDTEAEQVFLKQWDEDFTNSKVPTYRKYKLNSIQDVIWPEEA